MSTRCTTHFLSAGESTPTAIIYRHSDGYPEGAGADLLRFLDEVGKLRDTRFNDAAYLAAKYVVFLADQFNSSYSSGAWKRNESKLDFLSVGVLNCDPTDIDFRYVVTCDSQRPRVTCYEIERDYQTGESSQKEVDLQPSAEGR